MALTTYKIPVTSVILPLARVGPPVYAPAQITREQGTNRDWAIASFDQTTKEDIFLDVPMPGTYSGGNIDVVLRWKSTLTTGNVKWDVAHAETQDGESWDEVFSGGPNTATGTTPGTAGLMRETTVTLSGVGAYGSGNVLRLHAQRDTGAGSNLAADAQLLDVDVIFTVPDPTFISSTYTANPASVSINDSIAYSNVAAGAPTVLNLPAGATHKGGRLTIKDFKGDAGGATPISVVPNAAETVDGMASVPISNNYGSVTLVWNGTEWSIV